MKIELNLNHLREKHLRLNFELDDNLNQINSKFNISKVICYNHGYKCYNNLCKWNIQCHEEYENKYLVNKNTYCKLKYDRPIKHFIEVSTRIGKTNLLMTDLNNINYCDYYLGNSFYYNCYELNIKSNFIFNIFIAIAIIFILIILIGSTRMPLNH